MKTFFKHQSKNNAILKTIFILTLVISISFGLNSNNFVKADEDNEVVSIIPENGLPLVIIRVDETEETIQEANSGDSKHTYGTIQDMNDSLDHSIRCKGTFEIVVPDDFESEYGSNDVPSGEISLEFIRGRGNVTWQSSKKPYKIKFEQKQSILGMKENKEWGLLANYLDSTLTHNAIAMWIANQMEMQYTLKMVPVEVVMIGKDSQEFLGSYYLTELVGIGKSRVNIGELDENETENITGGYLLSLYYDPQDNDEPQNTVFTTDVSEIKFINENPYFESGELTEGQIKQRNYIRDYINDVDSLIMNSDVIDENTHSQINNLLDLKSTADYWLIEEFLINFDAYKTSSNYLYKKNNDDGGKLYWGPIWDYDLLYYLEGTNAIEGFNKSLPFPWLDKLRTSDELFVKLLKEEWEKLDQIVENVTKPGGILDQYKARQKNAWEKNNEIWYGYYDFEEVFEDFRSHLEDRRIWFNDNIDDIGKIYFTASFKVDGEVVKEVKVRGNNTVEEIDIKPEKDGYIFEDWVNSETQESYTYDVIIGDTTFEPKFTSKEEIGDDASIYFSNYESWANIEDGTFSINSMVVYPEDYYEALLSSIEWTSSNEEVATVSEDGTVNLLSVGDATIKGTLFNGASKSYLLHVYDERPEFTDVLEGVKLDKEEYSVEVGKTDQIIYHLLPESFDPDRYVSVDYEFDNEDIISLDSSCLSFIGLKEGKVNVTLTFEDYETESSFTKNIVINVKAKETPKTTTKPKSSGRSGGSSSKTVKENIWGKVDDWAIEEMKQAQEKSLIPETFKGKDFTEVISRSDFATIAVKLYESLTGKKAEKAVNNPFSDTDDEYVLKAYSLGITVGISKTEFGNTTITREQIATMIARTLKSAGVDITIGEKDMETKFDDHGSISNYAIESVYFMAAKEGIKGVGENKFDPLGDAKIEEALAISLRCIEKFKN